MSVCHTWVCSCGKRNFEIGEAYEVSEEDRREMKLGEWEGVDCVAAPLVVKCDGCGAEFDADYGEDEGIEEFLT
jgi:hypothetical protein